MFIIIYLIRPVPASISAWPFKKGKAEERKRMGTASIPYCYFLLIGPFIPKIVKYCLTSSVFL